FAVIVFITIRVSTNTNYIMTIISLVLILIIFNYIGEIFGGKIIFYNNSLCGIQAVRVVGYFGYSAFKSKLAGKTKWFNQRIIAGNMSLAISGRGYPVVNRRFVCCQRINPSNSYWITLPLNSTHSETTIGMIGTNLQDSKIFAVDGSF